jgi:hypothetical protein
LVRITVFRLAAILAPLLAIAPLAGGPLLAQEPEEVSTATPDTTAALAGQVLSALTGDPMIGANVFLRASRLGAVTDSAGEFRIDNVPEGTDTVAVWYSAYEPRFTAVAFFPDRTTRAIFLLSERVFEVAELKVEVRASNIRRERLERRKRVSGGVYISREDIEEFQPRLMSDMLRNIPRVEVTPYRFGIPEILIGTGAMACTPKYYVDGVLMQEFNVDREIGPDDVEDMEIYRGVAEMPTEFKAGGNRCGAIVIWLRGGR